LVAGKLIYGYLQNPEERDWNSAMPFPQDALAKWLTEASTIEKIDWHEGRHDRVESQRHKLYLFQVD
jgi:hypothetical protein